MRAWILPRTSDTASGLGDLRQGVNRFVARVPDWLVYVAGSIPVIWLFWRALTGTLGIEPVEAIEHRLGLWALWLLLAGLWISPLRTRARINFMPLRRAVGLLAFAYLVLHLMTWAVLDVQTLGAVWADILKRPYITIGMFGFALMIPLASTSWNGAIRRMGPVAWRRLHLLVYPAVLLGAVHFVMLRKGWQLEPLIYLTVVALLIALRMPDWVRRATRS